MTVLNVSLLGFFHCLRKRVGGKYLKLNILFPLLLLATGKSYSNQRAASEAANAVASLFAFWVTVMGESSQLGAWFCPFARINAKSLVWFGKIVETIVRCRFREVNGMRSDEVSADIKVFISSKSQARHSPGLGLGVVELCERVERLGSLNKAAADMGMAYSKAWRIVKQAEEGLDVALFPSPRCPWLLFDRRSQSANRVVPQSGARNERLRQSGAS